MKDYNWILAAMLNNVKLQVFYKNGHDIQKSVFGKIVTMGPTCFNIYGEDGYGYNFAYDRVDKVDLDQLAVLLDGV